MKTENVNLSKLGYCDTAAVLNYVDKRLFRQMAEFVVLSDNETPIGDVGTPNAKSRYMSEFLDKNITQIESDDFNFDQIAIPPWKFNTILCFEVIEHLQNPLFFIKQLKDMLWSGGTIYLSTPCRPQFLWTEHHFIEYSPARLKKWILEPLGLQIVRKKYLHINHHWSFYIKGFRPIFRLFLGWTVIYELKKR